MPGTRTLMQDSFGIWAFVRLIGGMIDLCLRFRYRVDAPALEHFTGTPGTLVLANHCRDADVPIIATLLTRCAVMRRYRAIPHFVARDDLFRRGFLHKYVNTWPAPIRALLCALNVGPVVREMHAHPMLRIPERSVQEVLEDVLDTFGDLPLDEVLRPDWVQRFLHLAPPRTTRISVSEALAVRYRPLLGQQHGFRKLARERFVALKPHVRALIDSQLQHFADLLDRGAVVQLEPEGRLSVDGKLQRFRGALHALVSRPRMAVRILPVGITYDFMTTGRVAVFVSAGPELQGLEGLRPRETCARIARAIRAQHTVTATQLVGRLLSSVDSCGGVLDAAQLAESLARQAQRCANAGLRVDPRLLDDTRRAKRVAALIAYCVHTGLLAPRHDGSFELRNADAPNPLRAADPRRAIEYASNELYSLANADFAAPGSAGP